MNRSIKGILAAVTTAAALGTTVAPAAHAVPATGTVQEIPIPTINPNIHGYAATVLTDGTPVAVIPSGGENPQVNFIDLKSHKPLPPKNTQPDSETTKGKIPLSLDDKDKSKSYDIWGAVRRSNNNVAFATSPGQLFDVDPNELQSTKLSEGASYDSIAPTIQNFWDITEGDNGILYIAGANARNDGGGRVYSYNPNTKTWADLAGRIHEGRTAVRSVAFDSGTLYAGMGGGGAEIYAITPDGTANPLPIDPSIMGSGEITYLEAHAGHLYAKTPKGGACEYTCVINAKTGALEHKIAEDFTGRVITRPGENTKVYYHRRGVLTEYDPNTKTATPLGNMTSHRVGRSAWANHEVAVTTRQHSGELSVFDTATNTGAELDGTLVKGGPRDIQSLALGPDGNVYAGFFMTGTQAVKIDTSTGTASIIDGLPNGQIEGMTTSGNKLVTGLYTGARVATYDPSTNTWNGPKRGHGIPNQQRPYALTDIGDGRVAVGTTAGPGDTSGGAFAIFDTATETFSDPIYLKDIPELAGLHPVSMTYRDGKVYVGTSIRGNFDATSADKIAKVFVYDVAAGKITKIVTPPNNPPAVNALTFTDDGKLFGLTGGEIHQFDPNTMATTGRSDKLGPVYHTRSQLLYSNNTLYTIVGTALVAVNPNNLNDHAPVTNGGKPITDAVHLAKDNNGTLYYSSGSHIYRLEMK